MDRELLYKFFDGTASIEEKERIKTWMESSDENHQTFFKERKIFDAMTLLSREDEEIKEIPIHKSRWFKEFVKIAAVIAVTLAFAFVYQQLKVNRQLSAFQKIMVPAGQRINLQLSDGTNVWLNARTKIEYPAVFVGKKRIVRLDGEAYFEVAKNKKMPFIVQTRKGNIEVYGTKFNLEAYSNDSIFNISLMEGSVKVIRGNNEFMLTPSHMAYLDKGRMYIAEINDYDAYRWKEGLICFTNESFSDIMRKFVRFYGVDIKIQNDRTAGRRYTGKFRQSDGIPYALKVLQKDMKFEYIRDDNNRVFYIK